MKLIIPILALVSLSTFVSCEKKHTANEDTPTQTLSSLQSLVLTSAPEGALQIVEARKTAKEGQQITLSGTVMGRKEPFVNGRAIMVLGDPNKITPCNLKEDDACPTPWDVCCDDPDDVKASTVTIQVVDTNGKPIKEGFKGVSGIKELSQLIVKGIVANGSNADNLLINATGIYVKP